VLVLIGTAGLLFMILTKPEESTTIMTAVCSSLITIGGVYMAVNWIPLKED